MRIRSSWPNGSLFHYSDNLAPVASQSLTARRLTDGSSRSISRVLSRVIISLGGGLLHPSSGRYPRGWRAASIPSYSTLLLMGFTRPACHHTAGGLLHHRFSSGPVLAVGAVFFSVALSLSFRSLDVIQHHALWSPDFPLQPAGATT